MNAGVFDVRAAPAGGIAARGSSAIPASEEPLDRHVLTAVIVAVEHSLDEQGIDVSAPAKATLLADAYRRATANGGHVERRHVDRLVWLA